MGRRWAWVRLLLVMVFFVVPVVLVGGLVAFRGLVWLFSL
jgi:hypothetical protein